MEGKDKQIYEYLMYILREDDFQRILTKYFEHMKSDFGSV